MDGLVKNDSESKGRIERFLNSNKENMRNPIIERFLSVEGNSELVMNAIMHPTKLNREIVDRSFRAHYKRAKKIKYISNLIYFFSVDFDKRERRQNERNLLILDKELSDEITTTPKQLIVDESKDFKNVLGTRLLDHIEDNRLAESIRSLTKKQIKILEFIYLNNISLKEISEIMGTTPQNISNHHRKALRKLYIKLN